MLVVQLTALVVTLRLGDTINVLYSCTDIIMSVAILLYAFVGYKKPHGNMLRCLFFLFGTVLACKGALNFSNTQNLYPAGACVMFSALLMTYVAGRLNKIEKNRVLLALSGILLLIARILIAIYYNIPQVDIVAVISQFSPLIVLTALSFAYIARYEEHKAAGLEDAN